MSEIPFVEDVYLDFSQLILTNHFLIDSRDIAAINSFYIKISNGITLTEAQGRYILKLLKKYQFTMKKAGLDYDEALKNSRWKKEFRILDLGKRVYIDIDDKENPTVCLKFPFAFKNIFETEFLGKDIKKIRYHWDHDQRVNKLMLYDVNLVDLHEFCERHGFEIDDTMLDALSQIEEIWDRQYDIIPHCVEENNIIVLKNATEDAESYWKEHRTGEFSKDLFLAKTMAYLLKSKSNNNDIAIKIASHDANHFWINDFSRFFDFYKKVDQRVAVILDSDKDSVVWLENFIRSADESFVPRSDIKVCFREDRESNNDFNQWIKSNNLGGKVDTGKIFIFRSKPAKWLINEEKNVNIVVTNCLFPSMSITTQKWFASRPCVIFLGSIRASQTKDIEIVQL
jgi:hypothetical protein